MPAEFVQHGIAEWPEAAGLDTPNLRFWEFLHD
jgi:hypothetical protein